MIRAGEYGRRAAAYEVGRSDGFHQLRSILKQNPNPHTTDQREKSLLEGWCRLGTKPARSYMQLRRYDQEAFGQIRRPAILLPLGIGVPSQLSPGHHLPTLTAPHNNFIGNYRLFSEAAREMLGQANISVTYVNALPPQGQLSGPVKFIQSLLKTWRLTQDDAAPLLGFEDSDRHRVSNLLKGRAVLSGRDVKDRIAYLLQIRKTLSALFLNEEVENEWLREKHSILNNIAPMELMLEGTMENLLLVKEYVDTAAGK